MSLETKIENLTAAVEALTAQLQGSEAAPAAPAPAAPAAPAPAAPAAPAPAAPAAPAPAAPAPAAPAPAAPAPSKDDVDAKLVAKYQQLTAAGKAPDEAMAAIKQAIGSDKFTELPPDQWQGVIERVEAISV